jgi:hypothetical protein
MDAKGQNLNLPPLPGDPLRAGLQMAGNEIDPVLIAQIEQMAHAALDQILQWAVKNILPALVQSISAEAGAAKTIVSQAEGVANAVLNQIQQIAEMAAKANLAGQAGQGAQAGAAQGGPAAFKIGQYPHGDVDLGFMGANVAPRAQPERASAKRTFYFLDNSKTPQQVPPARASGGGTAGVNLAGPKPG